MKIAILSAMWQRHKLFRIFTKQLKRYREKYGIESLVVGSEGAVSAKLCADNKISYMEAPNKPLSGKFNRGANYIFTHLNPDYLMILGSDDFFSDSLIEAYLHVLKDSPDVVGIVDCYFYNSKIKELSYFQGYSNVRTGETLGMGRCLSRRVLNRLNGKLWASNVDAGLDYTMTQRLKKIPDLVQKRMSIKDTPHMAVDIKGQGNISSYGCYLKDMTIVNSKKMNCLPEYNELIEL